MAEVSERHQCSVLGVEEVPREDTRQYGIVKTDGGEPGVVSAIVEKPQPENAPSTLAVVGRYILKPRIFHHLAKVQAGAGGEIQLTDGIAALLREEKVLAYRFKGKRYDCGSKLGYLQAMVEYGKKHPETGTAFSAYLKSL
jgi:UTP--glucose-1-phosphate uridylyltransferase